MRYNAHPALKIQAGKIISNQTKIRPALGRKMISGIVNLVKKRCQSDKNSKKVLILDQVLKKKTLSQDCPDGHIHCINICKKMLVV